MKSVTGGCGFLSPSPSLSPFAFPVPVSLHIWISPPADKEQGSGWREEKGMDWGGKKEKVRNWRKGSIFESKFPPCRKSKLHNVIVIV